MPSATLCDVLPRSSISSNFMRPASDCFAFLCKSPSLTIVLQSNPMRQTDIWYIMVKFNIGNVRGRKASNFTRFKTVSKCKNISTCVFRFVPRINVRAGQFLCYLSQIWRNKTESGFNQPSHQGAFGFFCPTMKTTSYLRRESGKLLTVIVLNAKRNFSHVYTYLLKL